MANQIYYPAFEYWEQPLQNNFEFLVNPLLDDLSRKITISQLSNFLANIYSDTLPFISSVVSDGVTITGTGSIEDPLTVIASGFTDTNFANTNLEFTEHRTHNLDGFNLTFEAANLFRIRAIDSLALLNRTNLKFFDEDNTNHIIIRPPLNITSNYILTLPTTDGNANQYLQTDGSGNLSWVDIVNNFQGVTGNIVDNTDINNPIINQQQADWNEINSLEPSFIRNKPDIENLSYIPITGTLLDNPLAGDIEIRSNSVSFYQINELVTKRILFAEDESFLITSTLNSSGIFSGFYIGTDSVDFITTNTNSTGIVYDVNVTETNLSLKSLINLEVLKSRLWTKNSIPTITDDITQGYVTNQSLILNLSTGILYRCTSNSIGAAVWQEYYNPNLITRVDNLESEVDVINSRLPQKARAVLIEQDFYHVGTSSYNQLQGTAISSGTQAAANGSVNHPGIVALRDSTTANGGFVISTANNAFLLGTGEKATFVFQDRNTSVRSTAWIRMGFFDSSTSAFPVDGVYAQIQNGVLTGLARNNNTQSNTPSTTSLTINTWYSLVIEILSSTSASFTLFAENGTQLWTAGTTGNIPTTAGRETGFGVLVYESTTDAPVDILWLDYISLEINRVLTR